MSIPTQEGDALLVEKKGRAYYKITLQTADPANGLKCGSGAGMPRARSLPVERTPISPRA